MRRLLWLLAAAMLLLPACSDDGESAPDEQDIYSDEIEDDQVTFNDGGTISRWYVVGQCPSACGSNVSCRQLTGNYRRWAACDCNPGYANLNHGYWSSKGNAIGGACVQCTPCSENATHMGGCYVETDNICECNEGFEGDGYTCEPIDPCAIDNGGCHADADCTVTDEGNANCSCSQGFEGNGLDCAWVDPCLTANGGCDANATCASTDGEVGATCTCADGYEGDGSLCTDIDECATGNGGCDENATCTNEPGTASCACNVGWEGDGVTCEVSDVVIEVNDECNINQAIEAANTNTAVGGCAAGNGTTDTILIAGLAQVVDDETEVTEDVVFESVGDRGSLGLIRRPFYIRQGVSVTMRNIRVNSGPITNEGTLTLEDVEMSGNDLSNDLTRGGAIHSTGTVVGTDVVFENNGATKGGAIYQGSGGSLTLTRATFRENKAFYHPVNGGNRGGGGAIFSYGPLTIRDSLFEGNQAHGESYGQCGYDDGEGSAIRASDAVIENSVFIDNDGRANGTVYVTGRVEITGSQLSGNDNFADYPCYGESNRRTGAAVMAGSGVIRQSSITGTRGYAVDAAISSATITVEDSTLSGNWRAFNTDGVIVRSTVVDPELVEYSSVTVSHSILGGTCVVRGTVTTGGGNLLGPLGNCTLVAEDGATPDGELTDEIYGPLREENGVWVHPLSPGSAAIDAYDCGGDALDSRSVARPFGAACDIGGYEFGVECLAESCECPEGTVGEGVDCEDINECDAEGACPDTAECINEFAGFRCVCPDEEWFDGDACQACTVCTEQAPEAQFCTATSDAICVQCDDACDGCDAEGPAACIVCAEGYTDRAGTCIDIDECTLYSRHGTGRFLFDEARTFCEDAGLIMAQPKTADDLAAVTRTVGNAGQSYVGAIHANGALRWLDGTDVDPALIPSYVRFYNNYPATFTPGFRTLGSRRPTWELSSVICQSPIPACDEGETCTNEPGSFRCE